VNVRGERIVIFGDSLSHPGLDNAPTLQDITRGSDRPSSAPGDLLGSLLLEQGAAAVRVNAKVGRSAVSFLANEPAATLLTTDQTFRPTKVIVMLGTNDAERDLAKTEAALAQIRNTYRAMGADVWAIGPMTYVGHGSALNTPAAAVFSVMQKVFGKAKTIDARPLSMSAQRAGDGIHFTQAGARDVAPQLASAITTASAVKISRPLAGLAISFGSVLVVGLVAIAARRHKSKPIQGLRGKALAKPSIDDLSTQIRESIQRQVDTTKSGKKLKECDTAAVDNLVGNIVGNLTQGVDLWIDEAVEEAESKR
jgi:lysophospholipase L1-like esterase